MLDTRPSRILVVGATSAIASALSRRYAARRAALFLVARNAEALDQEAADLRVRGATVEHFALDIDDLDRHVPMLDAAFAAGPVDIVVVAPGVLPDQAACERDVDVFLAGFDVNARSTLALLTRLADRFETQGHGTIVVLSSPAGDRGRASNYAYGAAKAAVTTFASGLRHRLHARSVNVLTVRPGFVDTPMTAAFAKGPLWANPDTVARDIERGIDRRSASIYTPWFWRWIMLAVRALPERLFVRTKL